VCEHTIGGGDGGLGGGGVLSPSSFPPSFAGIFLQVKIEILY